MSAVIASSKDFNEVTRPEMSDVVIPVGGEGKRMRPHTAGVSKNLLPVGDYSLLYYSLQEAVLAGAKTAHIVCSPKHMASYEEHCAELLDGPLKGDIKVNLIKQETPKGLGHAVLMARDAIHAGRPFGVILPDDLILNELIPDTLRDMVINGAKGITIATMQVRPEDTSKYGIFELEDAVFDDYARSYRVVGMVEKPGPAKAPSLLAVTGRYILPYEIMDVLATQQPGAGGEIQLTDAIDRQVRSGTPMVAVKYNGERYDCGNKEQYRRAQHIVAGLQIKAEAQAKLKPNAHAPELNGMK